MNAPFILQAQSFLFQLKWILASITMLSFTIQANSGRDSNRMVALYNMMERNDEDNSRLFACHQMLDASGVPYRTTDSLAEAFNYPVILFSSDVKKRSFNYDERNQIERYVQEGGVVFANNLKFNKFFNLFGIKDEISSNQHFSLTWRTNKAPQLFSYFDRPREKQISLGRRDQYDGIFYSRYYQLDGAESLGYFNEDRSKPGFIRNKYGAGHAYALGLSLRDVILRNQLNYDYLAERSFSNGFEPGGDVFVLLFRALCEQHIPNMVWKHTSPGGSHSSVMITHDIDSKTGMDTMLYFAKSEHKRNIDANYNITTRYFDDVGMSPYYANNIEKVDQLKKFGQTISSHSVGHFFDFHYFELGSAGLTKDTYSPYYNGDSTKGGYVLPEVEISKNMLQRNHNVDIRTFRAGHLRFPDQLVNALDSMDYQYESTLSANAIMYSFPFRLRKDRSFSGTISNVYEIPLTFSDVYEDNAFSKENWKVGPQQWLNGQEAYHNNYAPTTLLIHPNRKWKLKAQNYFLDRLPDETEIMNMNKFGDYWRNRVNTRIASNFISEDTLAIKIQSRELPIDARLSFGISNLKRDVNVVVMDTSGNQQPYKIKQVPSRNHAIAHHPMANKNETSFREQPDQISAYPNPVEAGSHITLQTNGEIEQFSIIGLDGKVYQSGNLKNRNRLPQIKLKEDLKRGMYVIQFKKGLQEQAQKLFIK